jgi:hypothetical protein
VFVSVTVGAGDDGATGILHVADEQAWIQINYNS